MSPSKMIMNLMRKKKLLPEISDTERQALEAGDVWIDGDIFAGKLRFAEMLKEPYSKLTAEEQAFIDGPCETLCDMVDPWEVHNSRRIPEDAMAYIKAQGFMGLMIPKEFGGKGFSRLAISTVMAKLMPHCSQVATVVIIANSLSAAELLIHYGTPEQKAHYLPKLANGDYVPCFGLTELTAGSDAESIKATAHVFRDTNGDGQLKLRLNFEKRYMTLGSIANIATVACKVIDPENLLGKGEKVGITTILVHQGTPGFHNGDHHLPIGAGFENGPLIGRDVVVSVDQIIGGVENAGRGWRMLMEQLAGGRGISLPAGAIGGMKFALTATGAYSMVRTQFGLPIGKMQGVEERVARMAYFTYMFEAVRVFLCSAIDNDVKPPVTSGMLKSYATDWATKVIGDGMDVFSGAGVMQGPNNILGLLYQSAPVGVTVEGANIMTRTFLVNGQGAVRCHPHTLDMVEAIEKNDPKAFRNTLFGWVGHVVAGFARVALHSATRGLFIGVPDVAPQTRSYYKRLGWAAARFGLLTDLGLLLIGGNLKKEGRLNGRYADAFAWITLGTAALRRFEAEGRRPEDLPLVKAACEHALAETQKAYEGIYGNFKFPLVGFLMRTIGLFSLRINPLSLGPTDRESHESAKTVQTLNDQFKRLSEGVYIPGENKPALGRLMKAFRLKTEAAAIADKVSAAQKQKLLPRGGVDLDLISKAAQASVLTAAEADQLAQSHAASLAACEVDVFKDEHYYR
jgi:acyl-CoA dehydrogenase